MKFQDRLERAIERGQQVREAQGAARDQKSLTDEELKQLHSEYRLQLSEHIEACLKQLSEHFPGFGFETVISPDGWGARISRDDLDFASTPPRNAYSRLELLISPFSEAGIIELAGKATISNKELFSRRHFQMLAQVDVESFSEMVDLWVLEYAEQYAARS